MKKMNAYRNILVAIVCVCASLTMKAQNNVIDEVLWVVGDQVILKSDVEEARMAALYNGTKFDGDPYCIIPEEIAIQKLFLHQAKIDSISVTDSEISMRVDHMINFYIQQLGSKEKVEEQFNKSFEQIKYYLQETERNKVIVQKMRQKIVGETKVTPSEVRRYFSTIPEQELPYVPTTVQVQILLMNPKIEQAEIDNVKKKLREYTDRVNKGEIEFSTLARLYSEDKAAAMRGGEIGFSSKGTLDQAYATVAFGLQDTKKVSKIVESEFGYHIIQLIEKRGDKINTRHILLRPKVSDDEIIKTMARLDSIATDIRNNKFTFEDATPILSHDKTTKNNQGIMVQIDEETEMNTSDFEMQDLPQEIAKIVNKMKEGEISDAFTMINPKNGKEVCAIIKLKKRTEGHKATVVDDYQKIKNMLIEKKNNEKIEKWIADKQKSTYVRINDTTRKCNFKYPGWNFNKQ